MSKKQSTEYSKLPEGGALLAEMLGKIALLERCALSARGLVAPGWMLYGCYNPVRFLD
jgi:hypothetical protein